MSTVAPTATRCIAPLFVAVILLAGCADHSASTPSPKASAVGNDISTFGDLFNAGRPAANDPKQGANSGTGNSDGNRLANTQPAIYDGDGVSRQAIAVGEARPVSDSKSAIIPAAYVVGQIGVAPADGEKFKVTFENADINVVARAILGDALKSTYTIDPRVHGTVSLSVQRPVSAAQLLGLLEDAMRANGAVVIHQDGAYRILPATEAHAVGGANIGPDAGSPGFGITALPLQNISAEALNKILEGFGAAPGTVRVDAARNLLVVRGSTAERQWLIDTALAFDVDWMRNQSVGIFPIKTSSPDTIINELNQLADPTLVKFQPVPRLNAVLAVAKSSEGVRQVQTWIARLDRENDYGPRAHVYRLKSADARKIVSVLKEIFGSGSASAGGDQVAPGGGAATAKAPGTQSSAASSDASKQDVAQTVSKVGEFGLGGATDNTASNAKVRIAADVASNSVVVFADQKDYKRIERAIIELDHSTAEVAIEAIVAEVTLNDVLNYGVQFYLQNTGNALAGNAAPTTPATTTTTTVTTTGTPVTTTTTPASSSSSLVSGAISLVGAAGLPLVAAAPGANLLIGALGSPSVVINALRDVTNVKVLSSPSIVVADNQPAVLQVGDQVPVTTGTASSTVTTQSAIVNSVSYVDTGVILRVTPHISRASEVTLVIEQEVSAVEQNANAGTLTPTISQQKIKSTVVVDNGQTVLLAGLISDQRSQEKSGLPGVVDLPFLGNILSNNTNNATRTELIVFVKPHVIHNNVDAQNVAQELRRRMPGFNRW